MAIVALLALLASPAFAGLSFQVEPKAQECFQQDLLQGKSFSMDFEVVRGGLLDIKLRILDVHDQIIADKLSFFNRRDDDLNEAEGRVHFIAATSGIHKICFDNRMSRWTAKVVSFHVKDDTKKVVNDHEEIAKLEHLGPVVDSVIKIADELDVIERVQHHMRVGEQSHRDTTKVTNSRVQWMAMVESCLLIGISVFQLRYIRQWFSESNQPGRV